MACRIGQACLTPTEEGALDAGGMTLPLVFALMLHAAPAAGQACVGAASSPALDHVILVVKDLDHAAAGFERHGFRIKPGRLHPNNLLNKHIKFRDGSSIELMTVKGRALDSMARGYAEFLAAGEGGVYLAMGLTDVADTRIAAAHAKLTMRERAYGPWTFLSFASSSPAAAVFFTAGGQPGSDPEALVAHEPDVSGLAEVWLEGGPELGEMLSSLGARHCGEAPRSDGAPGQRWALRRGAVVIVPRRTRARPRLLGVVLERRVPGPDGKVYPHPKLWVRYRSE
jgi:hypothetical protein